MASEQRYKKLQKWAFENCVPISVVLELTLSCNLKCVHCYNFDRSKPIPRNKKDGLSPERILKLIDEVAEMGTLNIAFTGGEALLHPHLIEFVRRARERHMASRLKTNAMLLTPSKARELFDAGVTNMDVSIYGSSPETHDAFTTIKGSFEKTVAGIRAGRDAGIKGSLSVMVHRGNFRELDKIHKLADELRCEMRKSIEITSRNDGTKSSQDHQLKKKELREMMAGPYGGDPEDYCNPTDKFQCQCARSNCGISATGDVYPCIGAPIFAGSLLNESFKEIWVNSKTFKWIRGLQLKDLKDCVDCKDRPFCSRSPGAALLNTGNYASSYPAACEVASVKHELYRLAKGHDYLENPKDHLL